MHVNTKCIATTTVPLAVLSKAAYGPWTAKGPTGKSFKASGR